MRFINVNVSKTNNDRFLLRWETRFSIGESLTDITLLWSHTPSTGYLDVLDENNQQVVLSSNTIEYTHELKDRNHAKRRYYKIVMGSVESDVVYVGDVTDGVLNTVEHAEKMLYDNYIGDPFYLLKRDTSGARCPECWDPIRFARTKTTCNTCNGTGFSIGYYKGDVIQVAIDATPNIAKVGQTGETNVTTIKGRVNIDTIITPRDMLVSIDSNTRYAITQIDTTKLPNRSIGRGEKSKMNRIVSQILTMSEIEPDDIRYKAAVIGRDIRSYNSELEGNKSSIGG